MKRREFIRTVGQGAASIQLCSLFSGCLRRNQSPVERPNILWIAVEDINPLMSCYGCEINPTPNIDRLAAQGVCFTRAFMPTPVCSPCRSALITGMMSTTLGTHNHHSSRSKETAIYLPEPIKTLPELFRDAGYFTFNSGKDDYNFWYDREKLYSGEYTTHKLYGKSGKSIDWNARKPGQPFFGQIQLRGGKHIYSKDFLNRVKSPVDRKAVKLLPYYPDHPDVIEEWARHLDCIRITDEEVSQIMRDLQNDGMLENTIVFFFTDHGMRLWRHKQFCYDSGLHVPFIVSFPGDQQRITEAGTVRSDLISGLDIAGTSLALAGIEVPDHMESKDLFARGYQPQEYIISTRDRCDFTIDRIRTVRTDRFRYIRNFFPDRPYMQPNYRDEWEITKLMRQLHNQGKLNAIQDRFWSDERPEEELYDCENDPHEINNLAGDQKYAEELERHCKILNEWIRKTDDKGQYPEDKANLKYMFDWWGEKCVNPEYDVFKK